MHLISLSMLISTGRVATKLSKIDGWHTLRVNTRNLSASSQISCKLSDGWRVTQDGILPCSPTGLLVYMNLNKTDSALALTSSAGRKYSEIDALLIGLRFLGTSGSTNLWPDAWWFGTFIASHRRTFYDDRACWLACGTYILGSLRKGVC